MKILMVIIFVMIQSNSFASGWGIKSKQHSFILKNDENANIKYEVISHGGLPKVISKEKRGRLELIIYYAGSAGTKYQIGIYRAVIYDKKDGKFLGDYPYRYESKEFEMDQPSWKFYKNKVEIVDEESGMDELIKF